jgi:hypothetical protein
MRTPFVFGIALLCALLLSQVPEFAQQYLQRLGGVVDELDSIVRHFDEDSNRSGFDRSAALGVMRNNPERLIREQGNRMQDTIARLNRLREQQTVMKQSGSLVRFGAFLSNVDGPLAERTWQSFVPALPFSFDGILFALLGFVSPYAVIFGGLALASRGKIQAEA